MAALTAAVLGLSAALKYKQLRAEGEYTAHANDVNASLADEQAADAVARGDAASVRQQQQTRGFIGSQRANLAAQGLDVNSGVATQLTSDTQQLGELDRMTIEHNAQREARGFTADATASRNAAEYARSSSRSAARGTLLTTAAQMYGSYAALKQSARG